MTTFWILAITFCISCLLHTSSATTPEGEDRLRQELSSRKYNKFVAPTHNGPVEANVYFWVINAEFKDWNDPRLTWNPADYNGSTYIDLAAENLWVPDIWLMNSGSWDHQNKPTVLVYSTGSISLYSNFVIESTCRLDLRYFPYDKQTCTLSFGSFTYYSHQLKMKSALYDYIFLYKQEGNDLKVTKLETRDHEFEELELNWAHSELLIHFERISSAYSVKLVLPAVIAGFLILMTFLLPPTSQEKVTLAGLIFVSLVLQLLNLQDLVPTSGETMIGDFLGFAICMDFFAVLIAVLSYYVHSKRNQATDKGNITESQTTGESSVSLPMPHSFQKTLSVLRFLDIVCFFVFLVVYLIGLAAILGQRE